jgi:hypothetical protein
VTKPKTNTTKIPTAIGGDVYIRDNDDRTIQMKAKVYETKFETQTALVGFYPERDGLQPSMLHLPQLYRAEIPLAELSLEPHSGAHQIGYIDALIMAGVATETDSSFDWMDHAGGMHRYGADAIVAPKVEAEVPEFDGGADEPVAAPVENRAANTVTLPGRTLAISGSPATKPKDAAQLIMEEVNKHVATAMSQANKPLLFTRAEILAKIKETEHALAQLRQMVEAVVP